MISYLNPNSTGGKACNAHAVFMCAPCLAKEIDLLRSNEEIAQATIDRLGDFLGLASHDLETAYRSMRRDLVHHFVKAKANRSIPPACAGCGKAPCDPKEHKTGPCGCEDGGHEPDCESRG